MWKSFISVLCAMFIMGAAVQNAQAAPTVIKIATGSASDSIVVKSLKAMGEAIEERSSGKFKVEIYDNLKLGSVGTCIQALQTGTLHIDVDATTQLAPFAPKLSIFDVPYLIENYDKDTVKVMQGETAKKILDEASTKRMLITNIFSVSSRFMETLKPVHNLEDAKSLKIRTTQSQLHVAIMKALGMAPIPMTSTEVVTSIQQGVIEGLDYNLVTAISWGYDTLAPFWAKFDHQICVLVACVNKKWWEKLPEQDRAFLSAVLDEFSLKNMEEELNYDEREMARLAKEGRPVFVPSPEEKARWVAATKDVHKKFSKDIPSDLVDTLRAEYTALSSAN